MPEIATTVVAATDRLTVQQNQLGVPPGGQRDRLSRAGRYPGLAPGARTTIGTAGKHAAISERDRRSAAVP